MKINPRYYQSQGYKDWRIAKMLFINDHTKKRSYRVNTNRISEANNQARDLQIKTYTIENNPTYPVATMDDV
jgi:hypothetical protein